MKRKYQNISSKNSSVKEEQEVLEIKRKTLSSDGQNGDVDFGSPLFSSTPKPSDKSDDSQPMDLTESDDSNNNNSEENSNNNSSKNTYNNSDDENNNNNSNSSISGNNNNSTELVDSTNQVDVSADYTLVPRRSARVSKKILNIKPDEDSDSCSSSSPPVRKRKRVDGSSENYSPSPNDRNQSYSDSPPKPKKKRTKKQEKNSAKKRGIKVVVESTEETDNKKKKRKLDYHHGSSSSSISANELDFDSKSLSQEHFTSPEKKENTANNEEQTEEHDQTEPIDNENEEDDDCTKSCNGTLSTNEYNFNNKQEQNSDPFNLTSDKIDVYNASRIQDDESPIKMYKHYNSSSTINDSIISDSLNVPARTKARSPTPLPVPIPEIINIGESDSDNEISSDVESDVPHSDSDSSSGTSSKTLVADGDYSQVSSKLVHIQKNGDSSNEYDYSSDDEGEYALPQQKRIKKKRKTRGQIALHNQQYQVRSSDDTDDEGELEEVLLSSG